jgi:hypothetical protein
VKYEVRQKLEVATLISAIPRSHVTYPLSISFCSLAQYVLLSNVARLGGDRGHREDSTKYYDADQICWFRLCKYSKKNHQGLAHVVSVV